MKVMETDSALAQTSVGFAGKRVHSQSNGSNSLSNNGAALGRFENSRHPGLNIVIFDPCGGPPWDRFADVYRTLSRELGILGHKVRVLSQANRRRSTGNSQTCTQGGRIPSTVFYSGLAGLKASFGSVIRSADVVVVGSGLVGGRKMGHSPHDPARTVTYGWLIQMRTSATRVRGIGSPWMG